MEGGVVPEAAVGGGLGGGGALSDEAGGVHEPLLPHIGVDGGAGLRFEQAHEMVGAQIDALGQGFHRERFPEMLVDVAQGLLYLGVAAGLQALGRGLVQAVYPDEQLDDERLAHGLGAEAGVRGGFLIRFNGGLQFRKLPLRGGEQIAAAPVRLVEAVHQSRAGEGPLEILPVEIEDDALIGAAAVDDGLVDGVVPHQQHRPGRQGVALLLHQIVDAALEQDDQLVKLMKVKIQLLPRRILQMKIVKALAQIARAVDV